MHTCPGPGCVARIPFHMLACRPHWYQVSRPVRSLVWHTWRNGAGSGTAEHDKAIMLAIADMRPL